MTDEQSRGAFEAWATKQAIEHNYEYMSYLLTRHPETGDYNTTWVDSAWMGWQACRATTSGLLEALIEERRIRLLGQEPDIHWESLRDDRRACYAKTDAAIAKASG